MIRAHYCDEHDTAPALRQHSGRLNPKHSLASTASMFAASRSIFPV